MATGHLGRQTKLTPEVQQLFVQAFSLGTPDKHACAYGGIDEATYYRWREKGREGKQPYRDFCEAIEKAKGRSVVGWLAKIEAAANEGNWQAAAWKLERKYPEEFGKQLIDQRVSGEITIKVIKVNLD